MKHPRQGKRIRTLAQLAQAAAERRSVLVYGFRRHPAAAAMNWQAAYVFEVIQRGLFIYKPVKRIDTSKPPRKWIPYRPPESNSPQPQTNRKTPHATE